MLRTATKIAFQSFTVQTRALSVSAARMSEGATGGTRSGGEAQAYVCLMFSSRKMRNISERMLTRFFVPASRDAFNKREKANEDFYVRQKEREKCLLPGCSIGMWKGC